jgi:hypothetical protein
MLPFIRIDGDRMDFLLVSRGERYAHLHSLKIDFGFLKITHDSLLG